MVGLGRVELPTRSLGIGRLLSNLFLFSLNDLAAFVLFRALPGAEYATEYATASIDSLPTVPEGGE